MIYACPSSLSAEPSDCIAFGPPWCCESISFGPSSMIVKRPDHLISFLSPSPPLLTTALPQRRQGCGNIGDKQPFPPAESLRRCTHHNSSETAPSEACRPTLPMVVDVCRLQMTPARRGIGHQQFVVDSEHVSKGQKMIRGMASTNHLESRWSRSRPSRQHECDSACLVPPSGSV